MRSEFIGYLYAITRNAEIAEEVYQNAAVVVMNKDGDSETIRNFRAWAKEVVRRQALVAIRERAKSSKLARAVSPEMLEAISTAFVDDESTSQVVLDESTALKQCLAELPEEKRQLIALRYEADESFQEISGKVDSSPTAVQRSLSRIRKLLHGCIRRKVRLAEGLL